MKLTFEEIRENKEVQTYLQMGNDALGVIGFTEHGFAHAGICAATAAQIEDAVVKLCERDYRRRTDRVR